MTRTVGANPVVVGVDGSESDEQVVAWGVHEAHRRARGLLIAHARDVMSASSVSAARVVSLLSEAKSSAFSCCPVRRRWLKVPSLVST
jgi:nucleotide-binding universal stress UspA family protein